MKVLIADDDLISRRLLEASLLKLGYEVVATQDGDEALSLLLNCESPKLVILDWLMPGQDGIQICRKIRLLKIELPHYIILLSSKNSKEDIQACLDAGADDYLIKPLETQMLQMRMRAGERILTLQAALADAANGRIKV